MKIWRECHTLMNTAQLSLVALGTPQLVTLGALPTKQLTTRTLQQEDMCHWRNMKIWRKRVKKGKISTKANTLGRKRAIRKGGCSGATPLEHLPGLSSFIVPLF